MEPALDLERKDVPALAVLDDLPDQVFTQRRLTDFVQQDAGVTPGNLCNRLLHN